MPIALPVSDRKGTILSIHGLKSKPSTLLVIYKNKWNIFVIKPIAQDLENVKTQRHRLIVAFHTSLMSALTEQENVYRNYKGFQMSTDLLSFIYLI